jgi:hypothetical protein
MAHMLGDNADVSLRSQFLETGRLGQDLHDAATQKPHRNSRLLADDAAVQVIGSVRAARYIDHRAAHAARFARAIFALSGDKRGEVGPLDDALLFPMLRTCLEDGAAIIWLVQEATEVDRWVRILRALRTDAHFFANNQLLLSDAALAAGGGADRVLSELKSQMERERVALSEQVLAASRRLGLEPRTVERQLRPSEPLQAVFGSRSATVATWKLLSELSHYSYGLSARLTVGGPSEPQSGDEFIGMVLSCLNPVLDDATRRLRWAKSAPN